MSKPHGVTVWLTGLSGSGKSTVAEALCRLLEAEDRLHVLLDGDVMREGLNSDLGFTEGERAENVRRVGEVAKLFALSGFIAVVPVISPFRAGRDTARLIHENRGLGFIEVHMDTSLDECERRDPKGLYRRARAGEIPNFTGLDSPYEPPVSAEVVLRPSDGDPDAMARLIRQSF